MTPEDDLRKLILARLLADHLRHLEDAQEQFAHILANCREEHREILTRFAEASSRQLATGLLHTYHLSEEEIRKLRIRKHPREEE